ncbi:MAG: hypothetical protein LBC75_00655 [Fibromonadaceae bacterium]|jgi:hypothetical protein|nr:hypothetical protein [Fibromonadaceae bacterium]
MDLEETNNRFNSELQMQIDGTLPKGHIYSLGYPNAILLSAGIENLPIELSSERIAVKSSPDYRRKHQFDLASIKDLVKTINNPIAIFKSTRLDGAKVILTDLRHNGWNFVVIMNQYTNPHCRKEHISVNSVKSLYPKDNVMDLMNWFRSGDKLIEWVDKEKALNFISTQSTNLIASGNEIQGSTYNIVKNFENVK